MATNNVVAFKPRIDQQEAAAVLQLIASETATCLPAKVDHKKLKLHTEIMKGYYNHRRSKNHQLSSIGRDVDAIADFISFSGKFPWECDEGDFEAWCVELGDVRELTPGTQRTYQGAVKLLLAYILRTQKYRVEIDREFGIRVRQICTPENMIAHILDREIATERPAMSIAQIEQFFGSLKDAIGEAEEFNGKDRFALKRDLVMFYLYYISGFRVSEGLQLNLTSFAENPEIPALGPYGLATIWRKGCRGSGKKCQVAVLPHHGLREMLDWYHDEVRPWYVKRLKDANNPALFLSERGTRLKYSALNERFQLALERAGLKIPDGPDGPGSPKFSIHSLRHTCATHALQRLSIEAVSKMLGHKLLTTTLKYLHIPDEFISDEINLSVLNRIDAAMALAA